MKLSIYHYRIMIAVFKSFGIVVAGPWKHKTFMLDFKVNQVYIQALLFELELQLGINLEDEPIEKYCCPYSIVKAFKLNVENNTYLQV